MELMASVKDIVPLLSGKNLKVGNYLSAVLMNKHCGFFLCLVLFAKILLDSSFGSLLINCNLKPREGRDRNSQPYRYAVGMSKWLV